MAIACVVMGLILALVGLFRGQQQLAYVLLLLMITLLLASALQDGTAHSLFGGERDIVPLRAETRETTASPTR